MFEEEDEVDPDADEDMTSANVLIREAGEAFGGEERIVAALDFMQHTVFRDWHGDAKWRARVSARERRAP
jgi:hypothetical protein